MKKRVAHYAAMEVLARRHAELDKTTAEYWLAEADLLSNLKKVEQRLEVVRAIEKRPRRGA
jgi:hypothetical protein